MINFKTFLTEKWSLKKDHENNVEATSTNLIGKHYVQTYFEPSSVYGPGHYRLGYTVNKSHTKDAEVEPKHVEHILHSVRKNVHQFIRHMKPKSVSFTAFESPIRAKLHDVLSSHIAKKYNGTVKKVHDGDIVRHRVIFSENQ